ncbi:MAG: ATP-binding protein [Campylobacterota bacterium]|nr:ATP-binding protein [Campylobacterota bacterium]
MGKICLLVCKSFEKEIKAIAEAFSNIDILTYQAKCNFPHIKENFDKELLNRYQKVAVIGGCTLDAASLPKNIELFKSENCFYMFAPKSLVDHHIKEGAYIITPGWLSNWKKYVTKSWGFDKSTAVEFYKEFCKKLLLLDTGVDSDAIENLKEFSAFVEQPYEVLPIGLDQFKLYVTNIVGKMDCAENSKKLKEAFKSSADHTMAFDLISHLNQKLDEREIIERIIEIFSMLFAPKTLFYLSIRDSKLEKQFLTENVTAETIEETLKSKEQYLLKSNGFVLQIKYNSILLGVLNIDEIAFPEYKNQYLNLAISLSGVCALAIANARNYQKTKEIESQLAQHAKLVAMGEMMGSIAHQWRQPLNELNINIEMLEEFYEGGVIDEAFVEKFVSKNTETIRFLSKTITDFSDFFRINKQKDHFSVKEKIKNTLDIVATQLKNNNIAFDITGDDLAVFGLPNEFQQVVLNIVNNAKDAIMEGGKSNGQIGISLSKTENDAIIEIKDNGGGIAQEILDRIYEPYFTTKEQGKGIGMGLYISKMIIEENMGGKLSARNEDGGTVFIIELGMDNGSE